MKGMRIYECGIALATTGSAYDAGYHLHHNTQQVRSCRLGSDVGVHADGYYYCSDKS
jgi:hypothetical protein